eukprot:CAMPEP_0178715426 /NCGR_PEP_ID=MMETSP0699-20121125/20659_1 /TAXON_ID=265572 /ORGANISM="Extubocellulus spinifer, Strain CCMP396" /LENGTH=137 /DNA_ID=CAMNT_0020364743 /DNA_START=236 /DNA_END=649 /DNA_ORIENTATION=+
MYRLVFNERDTNKDIKQHGGNTSTHATKAAKASSTDKDAEYEAILNCESDLWLPLTEAAQKTPLSSDDADGYPVFSIYLWSGAKNRIDKYRASKVGKAEGFTKTMRKRTESYNNGKSRGSSRQIERNGYGLGYIGTV